MSGGDTSFLPGPGDQPILQQLPRGPKPVVFAAGTRRGRCRSLLLTIAGKPNISAAAWLTESPSWRRFPPAVNTLPLPRRVAVCHQRSAFKSPTRENTFVCGSYISAHRESLDPPVIKTLPLASKVAWCDPECLQNGAPVTVKLRVAES